MRLLIDSHILLWLDPEPERVPSSWRLVLANLEHRVFVSAATAWELGIKQSQGKVAFKRTIAEQRAALGFLELPVTMAHAEFASNLPMLHADPFDRMLVAQAMVEGMTLVTVDRRMAGYGVKTL